MSQRTNAARPAALAAAVVASAFLGGCFSANPASRDRAAGAQAPPPDRWADQRAFAAGDGLRALQALTPGGLFLYQRRAEVPERELTERDLSLINEPTYRLRESRLDGHGLLRVWAAQSDVIAPAPGRRGRPRYPVNGSYVTSPDLKRAAAAPAPGAIVRRTDRFELGIVPDAGPRVARVIPAQLNLDLGVAVRLPEHAPAQPRGLVVHLPALTPNEYEQGMLDALERDGWVIAHIGARSRVPGPNEAARIERWVRLERRVQELVSERFGPSVGAPRQPSRREIRELWHQANLEIPMPPSGFEVGDENPPETAGVAVAHAVDQHLAEHAYAGAALVGAAREAFPSLAGKPVLVIGFSGGSLVAPAVAARLLEASPETALALVLVGSGAPILDVGHTSDLTDGGLTIDPTEGRALTPEQYSLVRSSYLETSRLDPWVLAPSLRAIPTLHVHASDDTTVPTPTAREFNDRLGRPDRLVHRGGHLTMFYFLSRRESWIVRWAARTTSTP